MISVAITNYNRVDMTIESFIKIIDNELIDDIIILDDCSDIKLYGELWEKVESLHTNHVKLYRNAVNVGPFLNKYIAIQKCKNDWAILLDCDNIIDNDYVKLLSDIDKQDDILYCPENLFRLNKAGVKYSYKKFNNLFVDKINVRRYVKHRMFRALLNTGNYLVHRKSYMEVVERSAADERLSKLDSFYFNYLWLSRGNRMKVVPDLGYEHRIHNGSYYLKNSKLFVAIQGELIKMLKNLT